MNAEPDIKESSAVCQHYIARIKVACRVNAIPAGLEAHTVYTRPKVGGIVNEGGFTTFLLLTYDPELLYDLIA